MPNLNHRLYSAFFPIFLSQNSAFFPPFFLPNPNGQLDFRWQNVRNTARRMTLRTMGFLVALFSTTRADAATYSTACPNCSGYAGAICEKLTAYSANGVIGHNAICVRDNTSSSPIITNASCLAKLRAWGMCTDGQVGLGHLVNTSLNCYGSSGPSATGSFAGTSISTNYGNFNYDSAVSGNLRYSNNSSAGTGYGVTYSQACCLSSGTTITSCCLSNATSCYDYWYSGSCSSGTIITNITVSGMSSGSTDQCSYAFYTYFSNSMSTTGWCEMGGNIFVEGTGALLIAHECFGTTSILGSNLAFECGVIVESCDSSSGYYRTPAVNYPLSFYTQGASAFCATCPDVANNNLDFAYESGLLSAYVSSSGSGITSCWAKPTQNPATYTDDKGTVEVKFTSDCQYKE